MQLYLIHVQTGKVMCSGNALGLFKHASTPGLFITAFVFIAGDHVLRVNLTGTSGMPDLVEVIRKNLKEEGQPFGVVRGTGGVLAVHLGDRLLNSVNTFRLYAWNIFHQPSITFCTCYHYAP